MRLVEVVVGSRLWGLELPDSDTDIRAVEARSFIDLVNPWASEKITQTEDKGDDTVLYDAVSFCRLAAKGNPTMMEILYSDQKRFTSPFWADLDPAWFYDPDRIARAHMGFAASQRNQIETLWRHRTANAKRIGKAFSSGILSLAMAEEIITERRARFKMGKELKQLHVDLRTGHRLTDGTEYLATMEKNMEMIFMSLPKDGPTANKAAIIDWLARIYASIAYLEVGAPYRIREEDL